MRTVVPACTRACGLTLLARLALDLELHRVPETMPTDERGQREVLNRLRTHIICFIIDRCFCINLGKPFMIPEDEVSLP